MTNITADFRPRLREGLSAGKDENGRLCIWDPHRIGGPPVPVSQQLLEAAQIFTGQWSLREIQSSLASRVGIITLEELIQFTSRLDTSLFLDGESLRRYLMGPTRRPSCIGCYPPDPAGIHHTVQQLFTEKGGPGLPNREAKPSGNLRAVLLPHMDYVRGNVTYGWGFKELIEQSTASLFVIIATSHYSPARFTLTRMNFQTPLGTIETDQHYIDRIMHHCGGEVDLFSDPFAHLPEHSIELELVILQSLWKRERPFRIVPLLCGSYRDAVKSNTLPNELPEVRRMIAALKAAEAEAGEEVCYLISGDLAHIGPKFDDPVPVDQEWLNRSRTQDLKILDQITAANPSAYYQTIASEGDVRRICGLPPTYLALEVAQPQFGKVLHYQQYFDPSGFESVSFASAGFYT